MSIYDVVKSEVNINDYASRHLQRAKAGYKYVCPFCGSGDGSSGAKSDSGFQIGSNGDYFHCYSCGEHGDIFKLVMQTEGLESEYEALQSIAQEFNIPLNNNYRSSSVVPKHNGTREVSEGDEMSESQRKALSHACEFISQYVIKCIENFRSGKFPEAYEYLRKRNHTELLDLKLGYELRDDNLDFVCRYNIGYDPEKKRLIFPFVGSDLGYSYYIARDIYNDGKNKYDKPHKVQDPDNPNNKLSISQPLFNPQALEAKTVFVVEGIFDWLTLTYFDNPNAIPLLGTGFNNLLQAIKAKENKPIAIFLFDNDKAGEATTERAVKAWQEAGLPYYVADRSILDGVKDIDELASKIDKETLNDDYTALCSRLNAENIKAVELQPKIQNEAYKSVLERYNVFSLQSTLENVYNLTNAVDPIPTGFKSIDNAFGDGLKPVLYTLGAISSLGKTSLLVQIADHIAKQKHPVLFISIEQGINELNAKSLSRYTKLLPGGDKFASTADEISNKRKRNSWSIDKTQQLLKACNQYAQEAGEYMHIWQADEQPTVAKIREITEQIKNHDGIAPVVFVDYLQLLAPENDRDSDKRIVDKNVMALKHLSREFQTPVIAISSLSRANYAGVVTFESFKESGAIEYGSDVLLGLNPADIDEETSDITNENKLKQTSRKVVRNHKSQLIRNCSLTIIKNRNGAINEDGIPLTFDVLHSLFYETPKQDKKQKRDTVKCI